jgi:hypothetical protein
VPPSLRTSDGGSGILIGANNNKINHLQKISAKTQAKIACQAPKTLISNKPKALSICRLPPTHPAKIEIETNQKAPGNPGAFWFAP